MTKFSVREQVNTLTLDDLTAIQIKSALGKTFSNQEQAPDHANAVDLVKAHQAVHVPTYGVAIPGTHTIVTKPGDSGIIPMFIPSSNKTYVMVGASVANGGVGSATVEMGLTDGAGSFVKVANSSPAAGATEYIGRAPTITFDSDVYPAFRVTSGTAATCTVSMVYAQLVQ